MDDDIEILKQLRSFLQEHVKWHDRLEARMTENGESIRNLVANFAKLDEGQEKRFEADTRRVIAEREENRRDGFALAAMREILSNLGGRSPLAGPWKIFGYERGDAKIIASVAYEIADAMIEARARKQ